VEVKIGVQYAARELVVDSAETQENIQQAVADAVAGDGVLTLTDTKGRTVVVPATKLAYVEIGTSSTGAVGFRG
jgi:mannose/fructose-specific phosphotransferase system component IIA